MIKGSVLKFVLACGLAGLLAACGHQVQTTSGSKYLSVYNQSDRDLDHLVGTDEGIAAAANVEPQLRFPARLGLARIGERGLVAVPQAEADAWRKLAGRLGSDYGEFVPVSPLVAALATTEESRVVITRELIWDYQTSLARVVREIRLGAARQHLDAVLIYETFGRSEESSNPLALTKLALIGFFLPTESVEAEGAAQAVLVDVRNGYTYGTANAVAKKPVARITTVADSGDAHISARAEAEARAVAGLAVEVEAMVRELRLALAEGRAAGSLP